MTKTRKVTRTKRLASAKKLEKTQTSTVNTNRFDPYKNYRF